MMKRMLVLMTKKEMTLMLATLFLPTLMAEDQQECRDDGPICLAGTDRKVCADLNYYSCSGYDGCTWIGSNPLSGSGYCNGTRPACETFSHNLGLCESYQGCDYYPSCALPTMHDCAPAPSCLAQPNRKVCGEINYYSCSEFVGCTWIGSDPFFGGGGYCNGTRPACETFSDNEEVCETYQGCSYFEDPLCTTDPFDVAITPLAADRECVNDCFDEIFACALNNICVPCDPSWVWCEKVRPSVDGSVSWEESVFLDDLFIPIMETYTCAVKVDQQKCQSCTLCSDQDVAYAAFNCHNVLVERLADNRCPVGSRCVGRDCNNDCICESIGPD